jgi:voltage-gated potassium channel
MIRGNLSLLDNLITDPGRSDRRIRALLRRLYVALLLILIVITIGVVGFMFISDYPLLDAFFMTITTVATVGYGEIHPLGPQGRLFASLLIIANVGIFAYSVATVTSFLMDGDFRQIMRDFRMNKRIQELSGHIIVCGYGRIGHQVVEELLEEHQLFVVVEQNEAALAELAERKGILYLGGDATLEATLTRANIREAKAIVVSLPKDSDNVFVVLTAREMNPNIKIVSRVSVPTNIDKLRRAGSNFVIMPERIGGTHMAAIVTKPDIMEFIELLTSPASSGLYFSEYAMANLQPQFLDKTIDEVDARSLTGANILGVKTADGQYLINPPAERKLVKDDHLIVLGNAQQLERFVQRYLVPGATANA